MAFSLLGAGSGSGWVEDNTASGASPSILLEDTTASAKDALLRVDADLLQIKDNAQADGTGLVLDLANNRLGIATAAPAYTLDVTGTANITGAITTAGNVTVSGTSPTIILSDTTASAKDLTIRADGDLVQLKESAGSDGSLLVLDLLNNRVGVCVAAPTVRLEVLDAIQISGTSPGITLSDTTASAKGLKTIVDSNKAQLKETAGADGSLLVLDLANNRVGIGTNSPANTFDVTGTSYFSGNIGLGTNGTGPDFAIDFGPNATTSKRIALYSNGSGGAFYGLGLHGSGYVEIWGNDNLIASAYGSSGTFGIGIAAGTPPTAMLQVNRTGGNIVEFTNGASSTATFGADSSVVFNETGTSTGDVRIEGDTDVNLFFSDASADKIGIGTSSPSSKLTVSATGVSMRLDKSGAGRNNLEIATTSVGASCSINFFPNNITDHVEIEGVSGKHLAFRTGGTYGVSDSSEKVRIQSDGCVGINTTSTTYKLDVNGTGRFSGALSADAGISTTTIGASGNVTLTGTAPTLILSDTTASAKDLTIQVDGDKVQMRETAGADGSLVVLDLLNNRLGVCVASPTARLEVLDQIKASGTSPSFDLNDTTASAKGLKIIVDADKAQLKETAGADGSLLVLDLANSRVGVATASPSVALEVTGAVKTSGDITSSTGDLIITAPSTPASAAATGTIGTIAWDTSYIYICTATDTWKRAAIATW